uniref:Variant surface glycoprotein 1125.2643 n=1 Tax=Trypanosoma brucei TaxID=5691 RepID=A0A1J0R883_9TRYP|nr:variant surface glycoprotein 1125.2643 [Trypanosoma brucei]
MNLAIALETTLVLHADVVVTDDSTVEGALSGPALGALCDIAHDLKLSPQKLKQQLLSKTEQLSDLKLKIRILDAYDTCDDNTKAAIQALHTMITNEILNHYSDFEKAATQAVVAAAADAYWAGHMDELVHVAHQLTTVTSDTAGTNCLLATSTGDNQGNGIKHDAPLTAGGLQRCAENFNPSHGETVGEILTVNKLKAVASQSGIYTKVMARNDKCPLTKYDTDSFYQNGASLTKLTFAGGAISMTNPTSNTVPAAQTLGITETRTRYEPILSTALHTALTEVDSATKQLGGIELGATALLKENGFEEAKTNQEIQAALHPSEDVKTKYSSGMPQTSKPAFDRLVKLYEELRDKLKKIKQDTNQDAAKQRLYKPLISCRRGPEAQTKVEKTSVCEDEEQDAC